jgi:WD40 repeat protein
MPVSSQDPARRTSNDRKWIVGTAFSPTGNYFAMAESNAQERSGTIIVYSVDRQSPASPFRENIRIPVADGKPYFLAFSQDEKHLAVSGQGFGVMVLDWRSGTAMMKLVSESAAVDNETIHVALSANDKWLAVNSYRGGIDLWDLEYRTVIGKFPQGEGVAGLGFSADGRQLITGDELLKMTVGYDLTIEKWKARACSLARDPTPEERQIYQLESGSSSACPSQQLPR